MVVASCLLVLVVGGAFAVVLLTNAELRGTTNLRRETREALAAADTLEKQIIDLETGLRGFVITRNESLLAPTNDARAALPQSAATLERLAANDPVQRARARRIVRAANAYLQQYALPLIDAVRRNDASARSVQRTVAGKRRVDTLRAALQSFRDAERGRLSARDADVETATRRATIAAAVGIAGSILLIILFSGYLTRVIVRPLRRAAQTADRLAGGDLSGRMPETDIAEIGALERSFNVMAGSLEESRDDLASLLAEQAALRRLATLVAGGAAPADVFVMTATEVWRLLATDATAILRYEPDARATILALETDLEVGVSVGARLPLDGESATAVVFRTGRASRWDSLEGAAGGITDIARKADMRSSVGAPIVVEGRLWGAVVASSRDSALPADTEQRLVDFTELVATAIANTEARSEVGRLVDEQAALRRVATLVAQGAAPPEVFQMVTREVGILSGADLARMERYESGDSVIGVAGWSRGDVPELAVGTRFSLEGASIAAMVHEASRPVRVDSFAGAHGPIAHEAQSLGIRSSVGCPIVVEGRLWGVIAASSKTPAPFPPDTESQIAEFTELVATAIANADGRAQLDASRARLLTTADEARRRVVRDLHDGAQQRLVHTILTLKLAQQTEESADELIAEALDHAEQANAELRELAHGMLPLSLARGGLRAGVETMVSRLRLPVDVDVLSERLAPEIEASAYFIVAESLTNVVKHSQAEGAEVKVWLDDSVLHLDVRDDGVGGARADGSGLVGLNDRIDALGGRLRIESPPGGGTRIAATLPLSA
jgi:signal transduction histidine kinase